MASKYHFGREWIMYISDDGQGPLFHVVSDKGKVYTGVSPTKPWTDVCVHLTSRVGKTRVSGPLLFGFSDPFVVHAIEQLPHFSGEKTRFVKTKQVQHFSVRNKAFNTPDCSFANLVDMEIPFAMKQYLRYSNGLELELEPADSVNGESVIKPTEDLTPNQQESILSLLKEYERGLGESGLKEKTLVKNNELGSLLQLASDFVGLDSIPPCAE
jgi:hypothetical protein